MNELIDTPKHQDLVYDIGMHKGEDSAFYLQKGFRVIAFEADPDLLRHCKSRLKNFIDGGQLIVVEGAIVSPDALKPGQQKIAFYKNDGNSQWGTVNADWVDRNVRKGTSSNMVEVDAIDFAKVIQQHGMPHYMKIDIEGNDMICVNAIKVFRERPDYISIESNKTSFAMIKREIDAFAELGYSSFQAVEQAAIPRAQTPPNPAREGNYVAQRFEDGSSGLFGSELGSQWKSKPEILRQYRLVRLGYYLVGDDGILSHPMFPGARKWIGRFLKLFTKANVPGWYDTHARHSSVDAVKSK
jgi:FkbM family methyltransferase